MVARFVEEWLLLRETDDESDLLEENPHLSFDRILTNRRD